MKTYISIISMILCLPVLACAQYYTVDTSKKLMEVHGDFNGAEIHLPVAKKLPEYKGGKKAWQDFLRSNIDIKVPFANRAVAGIYNVVIRFIVGSDGRLRSIGADSNCGYGMEAEVIRCIYKSGAWQPAETPAGKKVSYSVKTIVIFEIRSNDVILRFN